MKLLVNSIPALEQETRDASLTVRAKQTSASNVPLAVQDLGPFLLPYDMEGKPAMKEADYKETVTFLLTIEKLDERNSVVEKKEKKVELSITPFLPAPVLSTSMSSRGSSGLNCRT